MCIRDSGCPKPQSAYAEEATGALKDILFNFNKATLRPESNAKLDQAAEIIKDSKAVSYTHLDVYKRQGQL